MDFMNFFGITGVQEFTVSSRLEQETSESTGSEKTSYVGMCDTFTSIILCNFQQCSLNAIGVI